MDRAKHPQLPQYTPPTNSTDVASHTTAQHTCDSALDNQRGSRHGHDQKNASRGMNPERRNRDTPAVRGNIGMITITIPYLTFVVQVQDLPRTQTIPEPLFRTIISHNPTCCHSLAHLVKDNMQASRRCYVVCQSCTAYSCKGTVACTHVIHT